MAPVLVLCLFLVSALAQNRRCDHDGMMCACILKNVIATNPERNVYERYCKTPEGLVKQDQYEESEQFQSNEDYIREVLGDAYEPENVYIERIYPGEVLPRGYFEKRLHPPAEDLN